MKTKCITSLNSSTINHANFTNKIDRFIKKSKNYQSKLVLLMAFCLSFASPYSAIASETGVDGAQNTVDKTVTTVVPKGTATTFTDLNATTTVNIPADEVYHCVVTCSSTIKNTKDPIKSQNSSYGIGVEPDEAILGSIRHFSFPEEEGNGFDDAEDTEISSTYLIPNVIGDFSGGFVKFYCLAAKNSTTQEDFVVDNTSQTVVCSDTRL